MQRLEEPTRTQVLDAFAQALNDVFLVCIPFIIIAFVIALFLREIPLRSGATPTPESSAREDAKAALPFFGH